MLSGTATKYNPKMEQLKIIGSPMLDEAFLVRPVLVQEEVK
jgi:hypothetical protein